MRKRILLLTTGGTIASTPTAEGLAPGMDGVLQELGQLSSQFRVLGNFASNLH